MSTRLRRLARDTAIVVAVSLGLVLALELLLRLFAPQSLTGTSIHGEHFSAEDSILGYRYIPGAVWRFRHPEYRVEYAINPDGFRDATPHLVPKPPGVRRVLLLGDSFTFGQGVNYEDAWPVVAERELARRGFDRLELVKAGVQGMDTRSEFILMRRHARRLQADAVVLGFLINDLYTNVPYEERPDTEEPDSTGSWSAVRSAVFVDRSKERTLHLLTLARRALTSIDALYVRLYLAAPDRGGFLRVPLGEVAERQLTITEGLFERIADYCDSLGLQLVVLSIPQQFQVLHLRSAKSEPAVDVRHYDRHFARLAARRGFVWLPTLDAFVAADTSGVDLFHRLDGHLTVAGNAVLARAFVDLAIPHLIDPRPTQPPASGPDSSAGRELSAPSP